MATPRSSVLARPFHADQGVEKRLMASSARRRPRDWARRLAPLILIALVAASGCGDRREAAVARRGQEVMPFDLEATTHQFRKTSNGLVQTVVADDRADRRQADLIRRHLRSEAARFRDGDFGDPKRIHGPAMPGLAALEDGADRISVTYDDVAAGGQIVYATQEPDLVEALHRWADAQVADHGRHAEHD